VNEREMSFQTPADTTYTVSAIYLQYGGIVYRRLVFKHSGDVVYK